MYQVIKRDGSIVEFSITKIANAIQKAFDAQEKQYNPDIIDFLALKVTSDYQDEIVDNKIGVESIQDSVERVLVQAGYADIAKAYILYRKQREKVRNAKSTFLDYKELVDSYVNIEDWRVKENSTVTYSVGGLILSNSGRSDYCKLLAVRGIRRGDRKCSQKRRFAYTRPLYAHRLLRRLVT